MCYVAQPVIAKGAERRPRSPHHVANRTWKRTTFAAVRMVAQIIRAR
jgi:hypothetical protein